MLEIKEVIVVEGRYDKNTLSQIVDAVIIETSGFGIFNNRQKQKLLRTMAEKRGLIVLTDSDGAGFVIRNYMTDEEKIEKCMQNKRQMFQEFHEQLPDAHFVIMSGLLLPGRAQYLSLTRRINQELSSLCDKTDYMTFVDAEKMTVDGYVFYISANGVWLTKAVPVEYLIKIKH